MGLELIGGGVIVSLLIQVVAVVHYAGRMTEAIKDLQRRTGRIERLIDRRWPGAAVSEDD